MGEVLREVETSQDFQNKQLGHGLEVTLFLVLFQGPKSQDPKSQDPMVCVEGGACRM